MFLPVSLQPKVERVAEIIEILAGRLPLRERGVRKPLELGE
jgi:hypothetical protein